MSVGSPFEGVVPLLSVWFCVKSVFVAHGQLLGSKQRDDCAKV